MDEKQTDKGSVLSTEETEQVVGGAVRTVIIDIHGRRVVVGPPPESAPSHGGGSSHGVKM